MQEDTENTQPKETTLAAEIPSAAPKKPKKRKRKRAKYVDDGHTVYSMENLTGEKKTEGEKPQLTRKERFAVIRAALAHYFPILLLVLACFGATMLLMSLWLR